MSVSPAYRPDPLFARLGADFADPVRAADFPEHRPRWRNHRWAARVGLDGLTEEEWRAAFALFRPLPDNQAAPLAMRYHGHQFRSYNPDLGDGRGFLFAQVRDDAGRLLDLATKGSGQTPYSRFGDGRLTLKGAVREILAAQMLEALGVYTSKPFAVFETGEALQRNDEPSPTRSAVLTRLSHSHIRFGTFQRHAYHDRADLIGKLIDHCSEAYFPELLPLPEKARAAGLLRTTVIAGARLAASWMAAGFVHGVLNTDNMVVTGESFDYGPWRFLPKSDPAFTAAYFDQTGLYAFGRQPEAMSWNLTQLAGCLALVGEEAELIAALQLFAPVYQASLADHVFARLGLTRGALEADLLFLQDLFAWMTESGVSWAGFFHDWLGGEASAKRADAGPRGALYAASGFAEIRAGLLARDPVRPERLAHPLFARPEPVDMLIEEVEAIWAPIAEADDWSRFDAKITEIARLREGLDLSPLVELSQS
jgi:uncharacterized protein YdiU (UPF0061 family)